jgi:hypothetical protein
MTAANLSDNTCDGETLTVFPTLDFDEKPRKTIFPSPRGESSFSSSEVSDASETCTDLCVGVVVLTMLAVLLPIDADDEGGKFAQFVAKLAKGKKVDRKGQAKFGSVFKFLVFCIIKSSHL